MKLTVKEMTLVAMFAALACAGALLLRFGGTGVVPFSILPLIVLLSGVLLGGRLGALSMFIYLLIGLVGVPVFSTAPFGGISYMLKPTAGFLIGYIAASYVTGKIARSLGEKGIWGYMVATFAGLAVIYLFGLPYLYIVLNYFVGKAVNIFAVLKIGFLPFIGFDLIKAFIVSVIAVPIAKQVKISRLAEK